MGCIDENTANLHDRIGKWCKRDKARGSLRGTLNWDRLQTGSGYPKLKAKAAVTRHLAEFDWSIASRYCEQRVIAVIQLIVEFNTIPQSNALHLSQAAIDRIPVLGRQICCTASSQLPL